MHEMLTEEIILNQFAKLLLQKIIDHPNHKQIVRIPIELAFYCKNTFKKQKQINQILLNLLVKDFYLQTLDNLNKKPQQQPCDLYIQLLNKCNRTTILLSQIIVRVILMVLSVQLSINNAQLYQKKLSKLIKNLQIQLIVNSQQSISDLVIKELGIIEQLYNQLTFYQGLRQMFRDQGIYKLEKWIDDKILEKRKVFDQKHIVLQPFIIENVKPKQNSQGKDNIRKQKKTNKRVTINVNNVQQYAKTPLKVNDRQQLYRTEKKKQEQEDKKDDEDRMKYIKMALLNKKLSSSASIRKRNSIYVYKSNKKQQLNEVDQYQQQNYNDNMHLKENQTPPFNKQKLDKKRVICHFSKQNRDSGDSNSRALCAQTPPRKTKQ